MICEWHEDDAFWKTFYPVMFSDARWALADGEVRLAMALLDAQAPANVLDFCCGPGRHAIAMATLGYRVVGVDRMADYVDIGRQKAKEAQVDIDFEVGDVRAFCRPSSFDYAVSIFTSFGYFADPADDAKLLANVYESLRKGGKLLMDMSGKEVITKTFTPRSWSEPEPGLIWLEDRKVMPGWEGIENKWTLIRDQEMFERTMVLRLYSGMELKRALQDVGFSHIELYGSLDGAPYDHLARRLVAVAVK